MFHNRKSRKIIGILSRYPHQWVSYDQLEFSELADLDEVLTELVENQMVLKQDDSYKLNSSLYRNMILSEFEFLREVDDIKDSLMERVSEAYIVNPLIDKSYDLSSGQLLLISNYDNQRYHSNLLSQILENTDYQLEVIQSHQLLMEKDFNAYLEVLNW